MPTRVAVSNLNASTIDILNTIRQYAGSEYLSRVPEVTTAKDIPKVGEVLYGYPALANAFLNELMTRIALVKVRSATFNNPYADLKKGYLAFGETVEEIFVEIVKAREFSSDKAAARELQKNPADVRAAFHCINWRVQYPLSVSMDELRTAFLSVDGVKDLIMKQVQVLYTSTSYDEYLLFKYLLIKAFSHGQIKVHQLGADFNSQAVAYRGYSNKFTFMNTEYNARHVHTVTPKSDQAIFMDAMYNAQYDVNVLAAAFNMDKASYSGNLHLIDDWTTFDNARFSQIVESSDMIEPVTADELAAMASLKTILVDKEWFQVYDNLDTITDTFVSSGLYWNYNYNVFKTVSWSPFSNIVAFVANDTDVALPDTITVEITQKSIGEGGTVFTLGIDSDNPAITGGNAIFEQTPDATQKGIAVHPYGAVIFPPSATTAALQLIVNGTIFTAAAALTTEATTGQTITFNNTDAIATLELDDEDYAKK